MKLYVGLLLALAYFGFSEAGVSYVRWGRTKCPSGNIVLYKGFMAGSDSVGGGSGASYLCVPETPKFTKGTQDVEIWTGFLEGVELDLNVASFNNLFSSENVPGGVLHNQDMPCVLCHVPDSTDKFMVAGRQDCVDTGYELQYSGFLVSEDRNNVRHRSEFTCLDGAPEGRTGGSGDNNQAVVFPVQFVCGSLPCNPYLNGMEAPCAVCTY